MVQFVAAALALAFPALVIAGALKDATSYTIPNWISLTLMAIFPLAALAAGVPLPALAVHAGVGFLALLAGMAMFALRWIGGGDAKLFAVASLWLGWPAAAGFLLVTAIAGGALTLGLLTLRSAGLRPLVLLGPRWAQRLAEPGEAVPYGLAIAVGALASFGRSPFAAVLPAL